MKNEYEFYIKFIKPLEKKYNCFSFLYAKFKFKYFKRKKNYYNNILTLYYKHLQNNKRKLNNVISQLKK